MNIELFLKEYIDNFEPPATKYVLFCALPKESTAHNLIKKIMVAEVRQAIFRLEYENKV
jgi:hypothetical protein